MATLFVMGCKNGGQQAAPAAQALPFPVTHVAQQTVTTYNSYPVTIEGIVSSAVRPKVTGYIQKVLVDEGQKVRKGQALFTLETQSLSQDAEAAKAAVNVAQVEVDKLVPLVEKGIISKVQLETQKARLAQAQSNYNSIRANIGYATVKSPVDGYVGSIPYRQGALATPNDPMPLTTIADISQVYAYFSMGEAEYLDFLKDTQGTDLQEKIKNIPPVHLVLANGETYAQEGKIQTVTGQVDRNTGTVSFRAIFDNPNQLITNGNSGTVQIPVTHDNVLVVPLQSVFEQQGNRFIYTVDGENKVQSTLIQVSAETKNLAVVTSGVQKGETIVASGLGKLRKGMAIVPQEVPFDSIAKPLETLFQ